MSKTIIIAVFCVMLSGLPMACNRSSPVNFDWSNPEKVMAAMVNGSAALERELAKPRSESILVSRDSSREVVAVLDVKHRIISFVFRVPDGIKPASNTYRRVQNQVCMTIGVGIDAGQRQQELTGLTLLPESAERTSVFVVKEANSQRIYKVEFTIKPDGGCGVAVNYEEEGLK